VHSQVLAVLREKLLSMNLDIDAALPDNAVILPGDQSRTDLDPARRQRIAEAMADFFKEHKPTSSSQQRLNFSSSAGPAGRSVHPVESLAGAEQSVQTIAGTMPSKFLQLHDSYIVTQTEDGFVIIDQHALHERIIYEDLCRKVAHGKLESQGLLIPETFEINDSQVQTLNAKAELIEKLGIELAPFGPKTMAIQAFPTILAKLSPLDFVQDLIDILSEKKERVDIEMLLHEILDMASCKAAIKAGQPLTEAEMEKLLADKEIIERASRCPHGRPTTIKFTLNELEKQFKRT
jgi:DNA mismatch repair protein MutL